jgi:hypothetical protein
MGETTESPRVLTPKGRISYPNLAKPKAFNSKTEPMYSTDILFPKAITKKGHPEFDKFNALKASVDKVIKAKWGAEPPKGLRKPFKDGDEKSQPEYQDHIYMTVKSNRPPTLLDASKQNIPGSSFYGGCFARCSLNPYAYNTAGNTGVSMGLAGVQFIADGDRFSGGGDATNDFDDEYSGDNSDDYEDETVEEESEEADLFK